MRFEAHLWLLAVYVLMSVVVFALYAIDKSAAIRGGRRTPEARLHWFALLGGWPGALLAQQLFRHKSSKRSFVAMFWVTVVLNVAGLAALSSPLARGLLVR